MGTYNKILFGVSNFIVSSYLSACMFVRFIFDIEVVEPSRLEIFLGIMKELQTKNRNEPCRARIRSKVLLFDPLVVPFIIN